MSRVLGNVAALQRSMPMLQVAALVALFVYGMWTIADFGAASTIDTMLVLAALLGLAALGQTGVVLLGGLDLSIPGFIALGAFATGELAGAEGWPFAVVLAAIVGVSALIGGLTGWICHRQRLQPLVMTLATGSIVVGGVLVWTGGQTLGAPPELVAELTSPAGTTFGVGVPPVVVLWAVIAIVVAVVLHRSALGRRLYATGANPRAAELALVRTRAIWTGVFALSAVVSALVGVLLAGFAGAGDLGVGDPYLFQGITAIIVAGTTLGGARGDYSHTVVGALILTVLTTVLVGHGLSGPEQQMIFGGLILTVVGAYGRDRRARDRV